MKKYIKYLFVVFVFLVATSKVNANTINDIKMDIYIDTNGNAHISEKWTTNLNQGTEGYRYYGNLGNSKITNYSVEDNNKKYVDIGSWDLDATFDEKAYKSGIYNAGDHSELCFGISKYGGNTYTLNYTITGFVATNEDSDIIYWELIPSSLTTNKAYIKIHSDIPFEDTLDVWGYGNYGGYAYVYDGYIEMSNDNLSSSDYMTILVKFPKGTFATSNVIESNFEHYYDMAENGATHYVEKTTFLDKIMPILILFFQAFIWIIIITAIVSSSKNAGNKSGSMTLDFGETGKTLPKTVDLFRELPCGKDIYRAYFLAYNYKLMKKQTDFLGVILLKWIKQEKVSIESNTKKGIFKKEETVIVLKEKPTLDTELENKLYEYMYIASKDGRLESREFEKWCSNEYSKILSWFNKVLDYENDLLVKEGKLIASEITTLKVFKKVVYQVDSSMKEEAIKMKGLREFFKEFENMKDKEAIQVKLWEEYLMYAQIFGVANKVAKQFKELYPEVITEQTYNSMLFIHTVSHTGMASASSAKSRAESYSSGGGGFSSGGGGGGSFGGGGGGGFR